MIHRKKTLASIGIIVMLFVLVAPIQPVKAQFVLSGIGYPLPDGTEIDSIWAYVDSVFTALVYLNPDIDWEANNETQPLEVEAGVNITLAVFCWINGTDKGISSKEEGINIMRHNVTVTSNNGTLMFSQQNFTYIISGDFAPMYFYRHDVILDFSPEWGTIYTVVVIYEVFSE